MATKKIYEVKTEYGTYRVIVSKQKYQSNDTLAIRLIDEEGPFAIITVNLDCYGASDDMAYVDTNNCPWAEEFIKENKLGEHTGTYGKSGFCTYPLYRFDLKALEA